MATPTIQKPENMAPEHMEYLDDLRESGSTNMMGAATFLQRMYPSLSKDDAKDILLYWMETYE